MWKFSFKEDIFKIILNAESGYQAGKHLWEILEN